VQCASSNGLPGQNLVCILPCWLAYMPIAPCCLCLAGCHPLRAAICGPGSPQGARAVQAPAAAAPPGGARADHAGAGVHRLFAVWF